MSRHCRIGWLSSGLLLTLVCGLPAQQPEAKTSPLLLTEASNDRLPPGALVRFGEPLQPREPIQSLVFSANGNVLASVSIHGSVHVMDAGTGRNRLNLPRNAATFALLTSDGKRLLCRGSEGLTLRDTRTGRVVAQYGNKGKASQGIALAPDGKTFAEAAGKEIILRDLEKGEEVRRLTGHQSSIYSLVFSPDGKTLAAGSAADQPTTLGPPGKGDTDILLWDVETGKILKRLTGAHYGLIFSVAFSPDGKWLASSSPYDTCLWDVATEKPRARIEAGSRSVALSNNGKLLAMLVRIVDTSTGKTIDTVGERVTCFAFSPQDETLALGNTDGTIQLWDPKARRLKGWPDGHRAEIRNVTFSADATRIATVSGEDHSICIWNAVNGAYLAKIVIPCNSPSQWCATEHGSALVFGSDGRTVACGDKVFDIAAGRPIKILPGNAFAYSTDGKLIAGLTADRLLRREAHIIVWDRVQGRELAQFSPFNDPLTTQAEITAASFSPDSRLLAIGATSHNFDEKLRDSVYLYDIASGKRLLSIRPCAFGPRFLLFSPDGKTLATSGLWDEPVQLWRVEGGREMRTLQDTDRNRAWSEFRPIAFSPNGKLLAAGGKDNGIVIWDALTGGEVHRLSGHEEPVRALCFAPNGRNLLSGSSDGTAILWTLAPTDKKVALSATDLDMLWSELAEKDARTAYQAAWTLTLAPDKALALFKERLRPLREPDWKRIDRLLADLDDDKFAVRDAAFQDLKNLGRVVEESLRKTLDRKPSLEVRKSIERLLNEIDPTSLPPVELQQLRAIQVLEWIDSPAASALLEPLARRPPSQRTAHDAEAALRRLYGRKLAAVEKTTTAPLSPPTPVAGPRKLSDLKAEITALALTVNGKLLAVAAADGTVQLLDLTTKMELRIFKADEQAVFTAAFSPDGKTLATGGRDKTVHLWEAASGKPLQVFKGHSSDITSIAFSPDGKLLASGSLDTTTRLWDLSTGQSIRKLGSAPGIQVTSVAFSPDGRKLASGDLYAGVHKINGKAVTNHWSVAVRLWNVSKNEGGSELTASGQRVAFSPDGRQLATADFQTDIHIGSILLIGSGGGTVNQPGEVPTLKGHTNITLWDLPTSRRLLQLENKGAEIAFSPNGHFLATTRGSDLHAGGKLLQNPGPIPIDGRLRLWEIATGQEVLAFPADSQATVLAFAPDHRSLVTGLKDGRVLLWDLLPSSKDDQLAEDFERVWTTLNSEDAVAAYRAMWELRTADKKALPFLMERVRPTPANDPKLRRLIADLDAEQFTVREAAFKALERRGADAELALRSALKQETSVALQQRVQLLLKAPSIVELPDLLARLRALTVLEAVDSAEVRELFALLAEGPPLAQQTQAAKTALERLTRRLR